jgi:hypothetical protein
MLWEALIPPAPFTQRVPALRQEKGEILLPLARRNGRQAKRHPEGTRRAGWG